MKQPFLSVIITREWLFVERKEKELASPTMHGEELKYIEEAYRTNWMSTVGENINQVEKISAEKVGVHHSVALSSGTAALHMAVKLAGVKPGDKVFCSDMTFAATVNPIVYEGGIPIFIDTEYDTWNMDPVALERAFELYPEVKVIVVVHLYGVPCKIDEIRKIADKHGAIIIEDAAESLGATYKGIQTGAFGEISCISFNGNKIITGTSGGVLLTNNKAEADKVRKWSTQSRENAPWYEHKELGYNYRMSNVIAGVVRGQFLHLEEHIAQKKAIYERYKEGFKELPVQMNPYNDNICEPNFWLSCMIIEEEAMGQTNPMKILNTLAEYNAEGRPIWKPMHLQPIFENNVFITRKENDDKYDVGKDIFQRGLCLPSDNKMTEEQQNMIIEIVKSCFS